MNMTLSRRLSRIEGIVGRTDTTFKELLLQLLKEYTYPATRALFNELRWPGSGRVVEFETILRFSVGFDLLVMEDYRGLVPDEVLRSAYNKCRNWGGQQVRLLAGVIDEQGNVMPGYRLSENGCILDA